MFNAIEDAVIVLKGDSIKFLNFYAKELIGGGEIKNDTPFLYLFSEADEQTLTRTIAKDGQKLSSADILSINDSLLHECIFTTSEEISRCK